MNTYLPILIMFIVAGVFSAIFLLLSYLLGPKKPNASKLSVYECGLNPIGNARERFSVKYYLVAILFIVFDIEVVFMYPWALNYKESIKNGQGMYMIVVMGVFFFMLVLGLFFEWRKGVMNWSESKYLRKNKSL